MHQTLILGFLSLAGSGLLAAGNDSTKDLFWLRLKGGPNRCEGGLQVERPGRSWAAVSSATADLRLAQRVCAELDCGSPLAVRETSDDGGEVWEGLDECLETSLSDCSWNRYTTSANLEIRCSDSVRLLPGPSLCSGPLQIHWDGSWMGVCEGALDVRAAEVVCRELGCGAPSLLQGALSAQTPLGQTFHCEGHESALMECPRSSTDSCPSAAAVHLTCSEPDELRLVGGPGRCEGSLQLKHLDEWRDVAMSEWTLKAGSLVCAALGCGSAVSVEQREAHRDAVWSLSPSCLQFRPGLRECVSVLQQSGYFRVHRLGLTCSDSVRLLPGPSLCSGPLQIHWDGSWMGVCEGALDVRAAEVVCRELGCGAPSLLQGELSAQTPLGQMFHCEGHESALMECPRSSTDSCPSAAAVHLTCSESDMRLVNGPSRCEGSLQMKLSGRWREVGTAGWVLKAAGAVCATVGCGAVLSVRKNFSDFDAPRALTVSHSCLLSGSAPRDCVTTDINYYNIHHYALTCSDSVRLLPGPSLCSGPLQIHWDGSWMGVCEGALDVRAAEVVCRELGCGAPSHLQGELSAQTPLGQMFHCEGHESALMECPRSSADSCPSAAAVHLTCSEPLRLVGEGSRCGGTVELKHDAEWRSVVFDGSLAREERAAAEAVCALLDCGSFVSGGEREVASERSREVWEVSSDCMQRTSAVRQCVYRENRIPTETHVLCSDLLNRPNISVGSSQASPLWVLVGSELRVKCSVEPQYPGGSFQLLSPSQTLTLPALDHSAHFLFPDAGTALSGGYTCVYHQRVSNHNFSSHSETLHISVGASLNELIVRVCVILLLKLLYIPTIYFYCKATRGQHRKRL